MMIKNVEVPVDFVPEKKEGGAISVPDWNNVEVVLSIRQPWAWLIVRPDLVDPGARRTALQMHRMKDVENRSWPTPFRGRVLIHAGKTWDAECKADARKVQQEFGIAMPEQFDLGGIVGGANIVDCTSSYPSPWFVGPFGFVLREQTALPFRPLRGKLGFFNVSGDKSFTRKEATV